MNYSTGIREHLADVLDLLGLDIPLADLGLQHPPEELQEDLEAHLRDDGVIAPLAQLVPDEGVLGPGELVEGVHDAGLAELEADEVAAGVRDVGVLHAEEHGDLGADVVEVVEGVRRGRGPRGRGVGGVGAQGAGVDVSREVGDYGGYAGVELRGVS